MSHEETFEGIILMISCIIFVIIGYAIASRETDLLKREAIQRGYADVSAGQWHWLKKVGE